MLKVACTVSGTFKSELDLIDNPFGFDWPTFFKEPFIPRHVFDLARGFIVEPIVILLLIILY